ncbi:hypothetical protein GAYE_SCF00G1705 [Galdieria yellowstonensis]|uniref:FHA domain-containing protein n=1 Tax=Galdieria yellowstonensis TaxID=3028027 RepID=A0AAV9I8U8_9RHOD|nr:hypothetical protein GAYE_SCF00G1705 [Galdieria yellowstonensis]
MWYIEFLTSSPIQEYNFPLRFWIGGVKSGIKSLGRKANIRLSSPNASRLHATLQVQQVEENEGEEYLLVTDQSSYGTFVARAQNNMDTDSLTVEKLEKGTPVRLNPGDRIAFGKPGAWYIVGKENWVIYADNNMPEKEYQLLTETADQVGLKLTDQWKQNISAALFHEWTISPWQCLALIENIPVVHFAWVDRLKQVVLHSAEQVGLVTVAELAASYTQIPGTEGYFPRRSDVFTKEQVSSIVPNIHRKDLFSNKKFCLHCNEHREAWELVVVSAGGEVVHNAQEANYVVVSSEKMNDNCGRKHVSLYQITLALLLATTRPLETYNLEKRATPSPTKQVICQHSDAETDDEGEKESEDFKENCDVNKEQQKPSREETEKNERIPCGVWVKRYRSQSPSYNEQMKASHNNISFIQVSYPEKLPRCQRPKRRPRTISRHEMNVVHHVA